MFERPHHQRLAQVLLALNGPLLRENRCLFGGGTAMALRYGEYRESVDLDFLVSDVGSYRTLRQLLTGSQGIMTLVREKAALLLDYQGFFWLINLDKPSWMRLIYTQSPRFAQENPDDFHPAPVVHH